MERPASRGMVEWAYAIEQRDDDEKEETSLASSWFSAFDILILFT